MIRLFGIILRENGDYHSCQNAQGEVCEKETMAEICNVVVQQFAEFMHAFGVKEGGAMWLAPESRLVVW